MRKIATLATAATLTFAAGAWAQTDQDHEAHHPGGAAAQAAPSASATPPAGMPGMGGQGMPMQRMPGASQGGMPGMRGGQGMPMQGMQGGMPGMPMGGNMARMMGMMRERMAAQAMMRPFEHVDGMLAYVRAELHITDVQQPQWEAFANTVRAAMGRLRQAYAQAIMRPDGQPAPAPEQIERRVALVSAQLDAMRSVESAARPLYAALSPEQRRAADELMAEHFRSMRGMM